MEVEGDIQEERCRVEMRDKMKLVNGQLESEICLM